MRVVVSGIFDDIRSRDLRFLEEASRLGRLTVLLWDDDLSARAAGRAPKFGLEERRYVLEAVSAVEGVEVAVFGGLETGEASGGGFPALEALEPDLWVLGESIGLPAESSSKAKEAWCAGRGIGYRVLGAEALAGFPYEPPSLNAARPKGQKRAVVTGCFDWLHSGHVRFFEEAAAFGELNVIVGNDENLRLLKGEGHPLFAAAERRYLVGSMRSVKRALVSSGRGWLDAEPEIGALAADRYVVNEDGDRPEKKAFCESAGIEYIVLKRLPRQGLPKRASTDLRGF